MTTASHLLSALLAVAFPAALGASAAVPAAPAPGPAAAAPAAPAAADPCDAVSALADDAGAGPLASQRQRVQIACGLRDAMEKRYVFFSVKGRLLEAQGTPGFDARRHLDACVEAERAIPREEEPLRFYDRLRRCASAFEDGHLMFGVPARLPQVGLGFGLRLADGRVVVASRERKLSSYLKTVGGLKDVDELLAVGNEVLEIDGKPALEAVDELARYVPGSSLAARRERAVDALTRRDFAYPERRSTTVAVSVGGARRLVELPWWTSPDAAGHVMTRRWLKRTGIATTDLLGWRYDAARDAWDREAAAAQGYLRSDTILPARDAASLRELTDEQDRPAARLGEVVRGPDRAYCYLQILTFHTETLGGRDGRQGFMTAVEGFLRGCREKGLDLVLDLRQNEGGYIAHSSALFALLGEPRKTYPGGALLLRANTLNQLVYQERSPGMGAAPARPDDAFDPRRIADAIGAARTAGREFTNAFLERPLSPRQGEAGFPGRVVALTSPSCMSACDRLALLLQASGRAVLVGGPTEGAGGSQQETKNLQVRWSDPEGLVSLSIPNAAMGVQRTLPAAAGAGFGSEDFFAGLAFENRPVRPDVPYATRVEDVVGANRGWAAVVDQVLFGSRGGGALPAAGAAGP
ncbi:MAG TPA: S41 family peptidase [Anaeromyxobacteraceae bacterium]|nr:S41 family peptidase [Anaeromyxobacteraceae bacterium]